MFRQCAIGLCRHFITNVSYFIFVKNPLSYSQLGYFVDEVVFGLVRVQRFSSCPILLILILLHLALLHVTVVGRIYKPANFFGFAMPDMPKIASAPMLK